MGSEFPRLFVLAATLVGGAVAQGSIVPATMSGVEGGGGTNIPFGSNQACRYQVVYDAEELPWTGPRVITGISLRADNNAPPAAIAAKGFLDISVLMSTTDRKAATVSGTFAENYGADATWVLQNQIVQLPAQPLLPATTPPTPRPANIHFTFAVPWAYGLTPALNGQPAPTNLLVEIWIHSQPIGAYRIDNLSSCIAPTSTFGQLGPQCTVPGNPPIALTADVTMLAGSTYSWHVGNASPNMPFVVGLNLTNTGGLLGQPAWALPYPMFDPADPTQPSPALAALGWPAPDCWLNIDPVVLLSGVCDANGVGSATGLVPPGRQSVGVTYHAQALVLAPTANPLRMITSLGRSSTVCGPLGVARVFAFYDAATAPVPTGGSVQYGVGPVIDVQ